MADADIISRMQLNARPFSEGLDAALKQAEGQVTASSARINSEIARFSGVATNSAREVVQAYGQQVAAVGNANQQLARSGGAIVQSANQQRAAYQQLGFQLSDVVAQASSGTNAFVILAQQGGQTAAALSGFGGKVGAVASFLAGPFGAAVFGAVTVLGLLAANFSSAGGEADAAAASFGNAADRAAQLNTALERLERRNLSAAGQRAQDIGEIELETARLRGRRADLLRRIEAAGGRDAGGAQIGQALATVEQLEARIARLQLAAQKGRREAAADAAKAEEEAAKRREQADRSAAVSARTSRREAQAEIQAAEKRREAALMAELALIEQQGQAVRAMAEIYARLEGGFGGEFDRGIAGLRTRFPTGSSVFDAGGSSELKQIVDKELKRVGYGVAEEFEDRGLVAVQAIAQAFGGGIGGQIARIVGALRGLQTGDFTSVGGRAGGILTLLNQTGQGQNLLQSLLGPQAAGQISSFAQAAGPYAAAYLAGQEINKALGQDNILGKFGGVVGGTVGRLFGMNDARKSSVSLTGANGLISVGAPVGNSRTVQRSAAVGLGGSLQEQFQAIVESLGGSVGAFSVSIGQRNNRFAVDPTGRGNTGTKYGARQFDTEAEAIAFALQDIIRDGGLRGVSQTIQNALRNATSLERGLQDAQVIKSISDRVRALDDPLGATLDNINREFDKLRETLVAAGASSSELADLERLRATETRAATEQSVATLRAFQGSLQVGGNSPLSLSDQRRNAELAFAKFETDIRAGRTIDQSAFVAAGQNLLDVERQISGGTQGFFDQFNRVQGLTNQAISGVQNASAIREAELAAAAKSTADSSAALVNGQNVLIEQNAAILQALQQAGLGGFVGADAVGRGFARALG